MRSVLALLASLALAGCAVNVDHDDAENESDSSETAGALSTYGEQLTGAYETGAPYVEFNNIVLKSDGTYFSTKKIYCLTLPCDPIRDQGKFIGYKPAKGYFLGGLRLISKTTGKSTYYRVSLGKAHESLKLSRDGGKTFAPYTSVGTYCTANTDCAGQSYPHVKCMGYEVCGAGNKCGYKCGTEPTKCDLKDPTKRYVGTPTSCMVIRYTCDFAAGEAYFSNDCGCGCTVPAKPACKPAGCSGQICSDKDLMTTCEWRESYACYQKLGVCERGTDGTCGWRDTNALEACLESKL